MTIAEKIKRSRNIRQFILVIIVVVLSLAFGSSPFLFETSFSPVFLLAALFAILFIYLFIHKPEWAAFLAIFVILLPTDLIPAELNSLLNRTLTVFAFGVWFIGLLFKKGKFTITTSTAIMLVFIIWSLLSLTWAPNFSEGLTTIQVYLLRLVLFLLLVINEVKTVKSLEIFMNIIALSGLVLIGVSVLFIMLQGYVPGTRLKVLDVNQNALGISLLVTLPGVLWWATRTTKYNGVLKKALAFLFIIASIVLIGLSGSRGSAISLAIMLLILLIWKQTRIWGLLMIAIVAIALVATPAVFTTTIERFKGAEGDTALGGREYIWEGGVDLIKDHPLFGVGIGNSSYEVVPYMINNNAPWVESNRIPLHNPIMVIWADTGLIGLLIYLGVLLSALISFLIQFVKEAKHGMNKLRTYFPLMASMAIGYLASWIKGGGMESTFSYFLVLALLLIPSVIDKNSFKENL